MPIERKARKPKVRAPYKMVSPPTWELARAAYLGGSTARAVAERFDIGLQNLRQKIFREGWSKRALADARVLAGPGGPAPAPTPAALPSPPAPSPPPASEEDLMTTVLRRAREALTAGRGSEATALLKAAREYVVLSQDVDRAREDLDRTLPEDTPLSPEDQAFLADVVVLGHLGDRWAPVPAQETARRLRALWERLPQADRDDLVVVEAHIDRLTGHLGRSQRYERGWD